MPRLGLRVRRGARVSGKTGCTRHRSSRLAALAIIVVATQAEALDIAGPPHSVHFGTTVNVLPNGNIVVTDPDADSASYSGVGAAYLFGPKGNLISTITGSQPDDHVGSSGVIVLSNGNYVIVSPQWRNDTAANAGAVTWGGATTGVSGVVSTSNSLVGNTPGDQVGTVTPLGNGNYLVTSDVWDNAGAAGAGAVTWCNGNGGTVGAVSAANSLVGASAGDQVGYGLPMALSNGNYVVRSPLWDNGNAADVGAVTWGNGGGGTVGPVSAANSLIGTAAGDEVGSDGVVALLNGNYVAISSSWSNGATLYVGAVTWGNGNSGTVGSVSAGNSLVGNEANDAIGFSGVTALANGNYVAASSYWHNNTGAVTWANGNGGTVGEASAANSLLGGSPGDKISIGGIRALGNGSYVVASPYWNGGAGAVTWGTGNGATTGTVSSGNSLVGTATKDNVGTQPTIALNNGNYVAVSPYWNGTVGAVTWGYGNGGTIATVSAANSLVGSAQGEAITSALRSR